MSPLAVKKKKIQIKIPEHLPLSNLTLFMYVFFHSFYKYLLLNIRQTLR